MLDRVILLAEVLAEGDDFCIWFQTLGSLTLSERVPAVGSFCICCRMMGSLILSAQALAVGAFSFLVQSFMHVRCGSLT
jgi:hypothetical protein